ncbi:MAG: cob(I)yrinic acid a,c-diamide adenosyltransferase [Phycisphaerales bacterium]|nr:MAG: cob(I)yrinic acid a,c-diamide adenosyltransferase [Phycisphaerales bacterium]
MKLYTRSGDDGTTALFGGQRVGKDHARVEAYGAVDELNASLGLVAALCQADRPFHGRLGDILAVLQSRLLDLGADLATPEASKHEAKIRRIDEADAKAVEAWIDEIDAGNEELKYLIIPGGTPLAAHLHLARTVCRRAERAIIRLSRSEPVGRPVIQFVNRLSDLLFALARRANGDAGVPDTLWRPQIQGGEGDK